VFARNGSVVDLGISDNENSGLIPVMLTTNSCGQEYRAECVMPLVSGQGSSMDARLFWRLYPTFIQITWWIQSGKKFIFCYVFLSFLYIGELNYPNSLWGLTLNFLKGSDNIPCFGVLFYSFLYHCQFVMIFKVLITNCGLSIKSPNIPVHYPLEPSSLPCIEHTEVWTHN